MASSNYGIDCSVVLPCLNEAGSVAGCVCDARSGLRRAGLSGEVVVVDNGSTDGSGALARAAGARVVTESARGYGRALRTGIRAAGGRFVVIADADSTYDLRALGELIRPLDAGEADFVLGSRLGKGAGAIPLLHRRVGTPLLSLLIARACEGAGPRDSQTGFRAFRRRQMLDLSLEANGMELASEMLIKARRAGLAVAEVDVGYGRRLGDSKLRPVADGLRHLRLIRSLSAQTAES